MSRGKSYHHKQKGHPGNFKNNTNVDKKERSKSIQQMADYATYEAYKNHTFDDDE